MGEGMRRAAIVAVLAVAALLAVACSGGSHPGGSAASPGPGRVQQLDAFAQCLRHNGEPNAYFSKRTSNSNSSALQISIMGYTLTGVTPGTAQFVSAMKACKHLFPGGPPGPVTQQQKVQMLRFAACIRAHGYPSYPDPQFPAGGGVFQQRPSGIDPNSSRFQAAVKACNAKS
jgi:hypothetical protein